MSIKNLLPRNRDSKIEVLPEEEYGRSLANMQHEMNRMFDDFFGMSFSKSPFNEMNFFEKEVFPKVDILDNDSEIKIIAELPGVEENDIDIQIGNNVLSIRGEKKAEQEEKNKRYYRIERSYGSFQRNITLPTGVQEDKVEAHFKKGVLTISIPKSAEAMTKRVPIQKE